MVAHDVRGTATSRSTGWAGPTTRTRSRSPATATSWSSRVTTRSRAAPPQSQLYSYIADGRGRGVGRRGRSLGLRARRRCESRLTTTSRSGLHRRRIAQAGTFKQIAQAADAHSQRDQTRRLEAAWVSTLSRTLFHFVRVEDIAYDRRRGMKNVVYVADSGRGLGWADPGPGLHERSHLEAGSRSENPTKVLSLSILIDGDDAPVKAPGEIHQPDNLETTTQEPPHHRGSRLEPAVLPGRGERDHGSDLEARPRDGEQRDRREGRPVGRRDTIRPTRLRTTWTQHPSASSARGSRAGSSTPRSVFGPGAFLVDDPGQLCSTRDRRGRLARPTGLHVPA